MPVENASYVADLNPAWPLDSDPAREGAEQIRVVKTATQQSFPNIDGAVTVTDTELNALPGDVAALVSDLSDTDSNVATLQSEMNVVEADVVILQIEMNAVESDVSTLQSEVSTLQSEVAVLEAKTTNAYKQIDYDRIYPIGAIRLSFSNTALQPPQGVSATWVRLQSTRFMRITTGTPGNTSGDFTTTTTSTNVTASGTTGSTAITTAQMPSHNHQLMNGTGGDSTGPIGINTGISGQDSRTDWVSGTNLVNTTGSGAGHTHSFSSTSGHTHNATIVPEYIQVGLWQRTA